MLFELRNSVPEVSDQWVEPRDLFLHGKVRDAWKICKELRGKSTIEQANDLILNVEVARACGILKPYLAMVRLAHQRFPDDPYVQLYYSRMLQTRMRHVSGILYLHSVDDSLGTTHRGLWGTQLANVYADAGFAPSCKKWMQLMKDEPLFNSPLALYSRSCAEDGQRNWDAAIELAKQCVESAPKWTRARSHLVHCLLARGRVTEAQEQYQIVRDLGIEESYIDTSSALLHCALGNFEESASEMQRCLNDWPDSEATPWLRRMLYVLHVENGRYDDARSIAEKDAGETRAQNKLGLPPIDEVELDQPHKFIPIPLVAQNRNQCVPTTVAMATYPQGRRLDANALYQEMHGRNGTPLWRIREWANNNKVTFVPVRLDIEAIQGLLDRGIPLIGILEGPFNSHVDVVSGYHDGLKVFYVRDPAHWGAMVIPYEVCLERYSLDDGVIALIDNDDQGTIEFANRFHSDGLSSLLDLQQAAANGERESAEAAAAKISDDSILAYQRDVWGNSVTISQKQFAERMEALAKNQDANGTARFRAMMGLDAETAKPIFEQLLNSEADKIGLHGKLYVEMLSHFREGNWQVAHKLLERCLLRGSGVAELWSMMCDVLNELGRQTESKRALELAQELAPENLMLREKALGLQWNHLTYDEYASEIETMISNHPDERRILWGRVNVRREGPDGFGYESALRDHLHWFPRDMTGYSHLGYWYALQGRTDLANAVMDEARALMPENFDGDSTGNGVAKPEKEEKPKVTAETPLPETTPDLLDILWEVDDPRRDKAIRRLMSRKSSGQLKWTEHSQLTAVEIGYGLHGESAKVEEVRRLLPEETPGPTYWYANSFLDAVVRFNLKLECVQVILDWVDKVAPDYRKYANLWFNRIVVFELTGLMQEALSDLEQLLETYPAFSSALYRMGVLKHQQGDLAGAATYFERALEVNPGLYGAIESLRNIYETKGDNEKVLEHLGRLRKKMPFSFVTIRDEVFFLADNQGKESVEKYMAEHQSRCTPLMGKILQARLASRLEDLPSAESIIADVLESSDYQEQNDSDDVYEELLQARLAVALKREDIDLIDSLCVEGIERWPDSNRLKMIRAEYGKADKKNLLREVVVSGTADAETIFRYLVEISQSPVSHVTALVDEAPVEHQLLLAETMIDVLRVPELIHWNYDFLDWAHRKFPDSVALKYALAEHCSLSGKIQRSVDLARELHESSPEDVSLLRFYGRILVDYDAKEALTYLEQACEKNRSVAYLFDLARCYLVCGLRTKSLTTHREILEQNPYVGASVTNLYFLGENHSYLWPLAKEIINRGDGVDDEYFLVAAVKLALSQNDQVPLEWWRLANERMQVMQTRPGFGDEEAELKKSMVAWERARPNNGNSKPGLVGRVLLAMNWPGRHWVPTTRA